MNTKLIALAGLSVAVASANAVSFNFRSTGKAGLAGTTFSVSDTTLTAYIGTPPTPHYSFYSVAYTPTVTFVGASLSGLVSGAGTLTVLDNFTTSLKVLTFNFAGSASRSAATNLNRVSFANLGFTLTGLSLVGSGKFSSNLTVVPGSTSYLSQTTFISNLSPVPEPASIAAIAVGGLGLLRRRRKA